MLAGFFIGIGAIVYLTLGGIPGALLFALGLMTIVSFGFNLFTGKAGLLATNEITPVELAKIWIGNFFGAAICAFLIGNTPVGKDLMEFAEAIVRTRNAQSIFVNIILGIFCGVLMYVAVMGYKEFRNYLFIYIPVAVFILNGFNHCVADMFYTCLAAEKLADFESLIPTTIGNIIGTNLVPYMTKRGR